MHVSQLQLLSRTFYALLANFFMAPQTFLELSNKDNKWTLIMKILIENAKIILLLKIIIKSKNT